MEGQPYQLFINLPFGETMAEKTGTGYQSPYKFNGKLQRSENPDASGELDPETGLYYYGARYYDPQSSTWLSVDPLAEKYAGWTPYNYCADNPVCRIDPDGTTDYGVTPNGQVKRIGEPDKSPDKLYALNDKGKKIDNIKPITINDKSILPSLENPNPKVKEPEYPDPTATLTRRYNPKTKEWTYTKNQTMLQVYYAASKSRKDSKAVFEFCSSNSNVEWGLTGFKNGDWVVGTLQQNAQAPNFNTTGNPDYIFENRIYRAHSHSGNDPRIDFEPSDNDIDNANDLRKINSNAKSWLFMPKNPKNKWRKL